MKITWLGTACFGITSNEDRILFDPFIELSGGSYGVDPAELMSYDTVFVTHCHFDHLYTAEEMVDQGEGDISLFCTEQCCKTLEKFLDDQSNVVQIDVGRSYRIGSIDIDVLKGRHIEFQKRRMMDTLSPGRMLKYCDNLPFLYWANRTFKEAGQSVAFHIKAEGKQLLLLGSLAIDAKEDYPEGVDVLILPYQGNNDLPQRAREVLTRLKPKSVLLSHFDNAFPPMSRNVDLGPLKKMMREEFPNIRVVKPTAGKEMLLM